MVHHATSQSHHPVRDGVNAPSSRVDRPLALAISPVVDPLPFGAVTGTDLASTPSSECGACGRSGDLSTGSVAPDTVARGLVLGAPLVHLVQEAQPALALDLVVPAIPGPAGKLWRAARAVMTAEGGDVSLLERVPHLGSAGHPQSWVCASPTGTVDDVQLAWWGGQARLGWLQADTEACRAACEALLPYVDRFLVMGSRLGIGPIGWFLAEPLAYLGRQDDARAALDRAERVSHQVGDRRWVARCRLQRRVLGGAEPTLVLRASRRPRRTVPTPVHPIATSAATTAVSTAVSTGAQVGRGGAEQAVEAVGAVAKKGCELSARQLDILTLAAQGLTNAQIAGQLFLSVATVERHCTMAYRKLGVRNRAQAMTLLRRTLGAPVT